MRWSRAGTCCAGTGAIPTSARARAPSSRSARRAGIRIRMPAARTRLEFLLLARAGGVPRRGVGVPLGLARSRRLLRAGPQVAGGGALLPRARRARLALARLAAAGGRFGPPARLRVHPVGR